MIYTDQENALIAAAEKTDATRIRDLVKTAKLAKENAREYRDRAKASNSPGGKGNPYNASIGAATAATEAQNALHDAAALLTAIADARGIGRDEARAIGERIRQIAEAFEDAAFAAEEAAFFATV